MGTEEASRRFRKAEKRHHRPRIQYTYPPSPTSPTSPTASPLQTPSLPLSQRLRLLQAEVASLEIELADPSNPLLLKERDAGHADPGELIRGMVDVKGRIEKITRVREGRGKLVSVVLSEEQMQEKEADDRQGNKMEVKRLLEGGSVIDGEANHKGKMQDVKDIADMDRRVGELEKVVGSSSTALDELSPLPPPLLPLLTRLNAQLTLLTQPRHVDSISRRLKLLLSDLDRVSSASAQQHASQRRQSSHHPPGTASSTSPHPPSVSVSTSSSIQDQLTPVLTRLAPLLPHIPHVLTRLRTLSTLHTSAASFQSTLEGLEEEQHKVRVALAELERAVEGVERSMKENESLVKQNVKELDNRVEDLGRRMEESKAGRG
ncbi:hypothetical protein AcW1_003809 [Taiwanofungus camphoratus]|nr:hypothetical protein AcV5_003506 [Antrodia cinnamomea]KAI0940678.1 hypothetical protein AcW1_003809 [Antrodia cinnamomea]